VDNDFGLAERMDKQVAKTKTVVGILGTVHSEELRNEYRYPLALLEKKILEFKPDIICGEVRPEDWEQYLANPDYSGYLGPSEYRECIIPLCKQHNIEFVPVDWFEWDAVNLDHFVDYSEKEQQMLEQKLTEMYETIFAKVHTGKTPFNSLEMDKYVKVKHEWLFKVNPVVQNITWIARNQLMILRIKKVIDANPGKRILCIIGAEHNYYYHENLKKLDHIDLYYPL
jgi:hypothetical protein